MRIYDDYYTKKLDKVTFIQICELLQSYTIRRFLVNLNVSLNNVFTKLYDCIKYKPDYYAALAINLLLRKDASRFPKDEEVRIALKEKNFYKRGISKRDYILERLENYENREFVSLFKNSEISVEHIFPQHPDPVWKECLGEEDFIFMTKYRNTIANLTLSGNNGALGNKSFNAKKEMNFDGKEQGYLFSRLWLSKDLQGFDKWGLDEFEIRFERLFARFMQVWEYPNLKLPDENEELEVRIIESDIRQYRNLDYAIILGKRVKVRSIHDVYSYVLKEFFQSNREVLLNADNMFTFGITGNKDEIKKAIPLTDRLYAEGGYGRKLKLDKIKFLLRIFEEEEARVVKTKRLKKCEVEQLNIFSEPIS